MMNEMLNKGCVLITVLGIALLASAGQAAEPCGGVRFDAGYVKGGKPLPAKAELAGDDLACVKAVGAALKERSQIRAITVAVRVAADRRQEGALIAAAWTKLLVAAGIPEARISTIVPTGPSGVPNELTVQYREPTPRPVALVQAMTGKVSCGADATKLSLTSTGANLIQGDIVSTDKGSVVRLALADGSFVSLLPESSIRLGRVELTADLKRAVRIDLLRGKVEAIADPKGAGSSFDIVTKTAIAGVRGTRFRVGDLPSGSTGVETLDGKVELQSQTGAKETVVVEAGMAAEVDHLGKATPPRALLKAPLVEPPFSGELPATAVLKWQPVDTAKLYKVELGADGELATAMRVFTTATPQLPIPKELAVGHWFWRVSAIDTGEVAGYPSKTYSFSLR